MKTNFYSFTAQDILPWLLEQSINRKVKRIQQHHTFRPNYSHFDGTNHQKRQQAMKDYHTQKKKWKDIAQHFTTFPDGQILTGRNLETIPVGILGQNSGSICIENLGNFDEEQDEMTEEQKEAVIALTAALCIKFDVVPSSDTIIYHHWYDLKTGKLDLDSDNRKSCPGSNFFGGNQPINCQENFIPLVQAKIIELIKSQQI